jgi:hypothetical protein
MVRYPSARELRLWALPESYEGGHLTPLNSLGLSIESLARQCRMLN